MATPKPAPANSMPPEQANVINRNILQRTAPLVMKRLGTFTGSVGGNTRIKLFNVGLITRVVLLVTANVTIATANATVGPKGAHAAISRIKLTDFDGSDRINASGFQLFQLQSLRQKHTGLFGRSNVQSNVNNAAGAAGLTSALTNPSIPTAQATANMTFAVELPLAFDVEGGDLRGILMAQSTVGELWVSIDWASAAGWLTNGSDDSVYNGAATSALTVNSISVEAYQEYYLPQQVNGMLPLPQIDMLTVYELAGAMRSSDNIVSGQDKLLSMPNARTIIGVYASYLNNSILGGSSGNDLQAFKIIANGNNLIKEFGSAFAMYYEQRRALGTDMPLGAYFYDMVKGPIATFLYGNVQTAWQPGGTVTAGASLEIMYESFYVKGAALSGLSQSG